MNVQQTTIRAFLDALGHAVYWGFALAILFGGIAYFTRRNAMKKTGRRQKK